MLDASIEHEWHMFSQFTPDGGSLPSVFEYKNAKGNYELVGKTKESPYKKVYNDVFEVDEYMFENKAQFRQTIKVTNPNLKSVTVYVDYQVCKESCIRDEKTFDIKLPTLTGKVAELAEVIKVDSTVTAVKDSIVTENTVAVNTPSDNPIEKKDEKKDCL